MLRPSPTGTFADTSQNTGLHMTQCGGEGGVAFMLAYASKCQYQCNVWVLHAQHNTADAIFQLHMPCWAGGHSHFWKRTRSATQATNTTLLSGLPHGLFVAC